MSDSPWNDAAGYPRMCEKTAIRRLAKIVPNSSEKLKQAIAMEDALEANYRVLPDDDSSVEEFNALEPATKPPAKKPAPAKEQPATTPPPKTESYADLSTRINEAGNNANKKQLEAARELVNASFNAEGITSDEAATLEGNILDWLAAIE